MHEIIQRRFDHLSLVLIVVLILICMTACGGGSTPTPASLVSVTITPANPSVAMGLTQQLTASGTYSDGSSRDLSNSVTWSSANTGVVSVSSSGMATSVAQGTSVITATSGTVSATATFTVTAPVLASIAVSPGTATVAMGLNQQFAATGTLTDKSKQAVTDVVWASSASSVAAISASGLLTPKALGTTTITATSGSIKGSASVTVTPAALVSITVNPPVASVAAGLQQQFAATGSFTDGSSQALTSVTWATSDQTLADISSTGLATTHHPGAVSVSATSGSISGSSQLTIGPPILTGLAVHPKSASVQIGAAPQKLAAIGSYSDQSAADLSNEASWTVSNSYIATVDATGAASPQRTGFTRVTATLNSLSDTAGLTVLATPRFIYDLSDAARQISTMTVDAVSGQPRYRGYQATRQYTNVGFGCVTTDPSNKYAYVTGQVISGAGYAGQISAFTMDSTTGSLALNSGYPREVSEAIGCIQFEPSGKFAYATPGIEEATNDLVMLSNDGQGNLSIAGAITLPSYPAGLAIDPVGKFLYVVSEAITAGSPAAIYGYRIDSPTGLLTQIDGMPVALPTNSYGFLSFDPAGDHLYLAYNSGNSIVNFNVDRSSGALTSGATNIAPCINPSTVQFSPDGSLAFTTCTMNNSHDANSAALVSFRVAANGGLTQLATAYSGVSMDVKVDGAGKHVYVVGYAGSNSGNVLYTYKVNDDGSPSLLSQTAGRNVPNSLTLVGGASPVTYTTQHAYATTSGDSKLTAFDVADDGSLQAIQAANTLTSPLGLATLPWNSDLLLVAQPQPPTGPNVQGYGVNEGNGTFSPGITLQNAVSPGGIVMDPSGKNAFVTDRATGLVYQYGFVKQGWWGTLTNAQGLPATFTAQGGAGPLAIDPAGCSLFVANQTANSISQFQFAGAGSVPPLALSASPTAICADALGNYLFAVTSDNKLRMIAVDTAGNMTDAFDVNLAGSPTGVVTDPAGKYVYVAGVNGLSAFSIDRKVGTLTALTLSSAAALANATGVYVEPSGKYLYVSISNSNGNSLNVFTIAADGTLSSTYLTIPTSDKVTSVMFHSQIQ